MSRFDRFAEVDTDHVDLETGLFRMVLATEGEAEDGHILRVGGCKADARSPLCINHDLDPERQLGSIFDPKPDGDVLRAMGQIELGGEGWRSDVRRDIAYMMAQGHIRAVSARGRGIKTIERAKLPRGHKASVDAGKSRGAQRHGLFFDEWELIEGSIVGRGADPKALIGRSQETKGEVSLFWRSIVEHQGDEDESVIPLSTFLRVCGENAELADQCRALEERVTALTTPPQQVPAVEGIDFGRLLEAEMAGYEQRLQERLSRWAETTLGRIIR